VKDGVTQLSDSGINLHVVLGGFELDKRVRELGKHRLAVGFPEQIFRNLALLSERTRLVVTWHEI
jgi:hypothetical protein